MHALVAHSMKLYFMHISQNTFFFYLIYVFFDVDSKSEIIIFRTALVFELYEEKKRKSRHNKTQVSKCFLPFYSKK